jgi:hypothetical protein
MSLDRVTVVIFFALLVGWYGRHLLQATSDVKAAKGRLRGARRIYWTAFRIAVVVAFVIFIAARFWLHQHGA